MNVKEWKTEKWIYRYYVTQYANEFFSFSMSLDFCHLFITKRLKHPLFAFHEVFLVQLSFLSIKLLLIKYWNTRRKRFWFTFYSVNFLIEKKYTFNVMKIQLSYYIIMYWFYNALYCKDVNSTKFVLKDLIELKIIEQDII